MVGNASSGAARGIASQDFHEVSRREQAVNSAVFVEHQRHARASFLEALQRLVDGHTPWQKQRPAQQRSKLEGLPREQPRHEIPRRERAYHAVGIATAHRVMAIGSVRRASRPRRGAARPARWTGWPTTARGAADVR